MSGAEKLAPCPFCGSSDLDTPGLCYVHCRGCGARGPDFQVGISPGTLWNAAAAKRLASVEDEASRLASVRASDMGPERDRARDALRALVEAMDAQVAASLQGDDRTEADAAFARALSAARGVL